MLVDTDSEVEIGEETSVQESVPEPPVSYYKQQEQQPIRYDLTFQSPLSHLYI